MEESHKSNDGRFIEYEKGHPFYKLVKNVYSPSMNLLKTFDTRKPNYTDFLKDAEKYKWSEICTDSLLLILTDVEIFGKKINLTNCQTAAVLEIFYSCFQYFVMLPALDKNAFLVYFRETLLLYTVQDPPESLRIFNGTEGFAIAKLFHELMENNFEIMKLVLIPMYRIEIDVANIN